MKNRLTKFFTVFLAVVLCIGMAPATGSTAYAASRWGGSSISSWWNSWFGGSNSGSNNNNSSSNSNQAGENDATSSNSSTVDLDELDGSGSSNGQLSLTKTITHNSGDNYTIKLEAYATGEVKTTTQTTDVPTDIVLVLDQSGSMKTNMYNYKEIYYISTKNSYYVKVNNEWKEVSYSKGGWGQQSGWYYNSWDGRKYVTPKTSENDANSNHTQFYTRTEQTRLEALKAAVNTFVTEIQNKAASSKAKYRVAIVGFGMGENTQSGYSKYENTELFIGGTQYTYGSTSISGQYKNAFQDMSTTTGQNNITASINALAAKGATRADLGMTMANNIFNANTIQDGEKRNRVVVMFTDGEPNNQSGFVDSVATNTIKQANTSKSTGKNGYGASVYTLGILEGANPGAAIDTGSSNTAKINRYMNYVSSNFPNATELNKPGTGGDVSKGFYKKADDAAELKNAFESISSSIESGSTSVTLNQNSVLRDVISDDFSLPANADKNSIVVKTADYAGKNNDGTLKWTDESTFGDAQVSISGKTINVSNFNYNQLFAANVGGKNQGKKLIVEIPVTINRNFGANNVLSNASAGIYPLADSKDPYITVESPEGSHPTEYGVKGTEQWIDENTSATIESLIGYTKDGDFEYKPDGVKNKYVDIVYTIKDKQGNTVGTYTVEHGKTTGTYSNVNTPKLDVDTVYDVEVTITPIAGATDADKACGRQAETKTYKTKSYVYINGVTRAFVIDFDKPVTYTKEQVFTENQLSTSEKINAISYKEGTNTYGNLTLNNDKSITYRLNKFMDGIDRYTFNVANNCTQKVNMIPATSVYYDDSFTAKDGNGIVDGITYTGNWKVANKEDIGYQDSTQGNYGYDSSEELIGNSNGTVHFLDATNKATANASVTFKGTGIDIYSKVDNTSGRIAVRLYKDNKVVQTKVIDTSYQSGTLYQVPTITFKDLEYGQYTVKITIPKGQIFYLDGLRIYNPTKDKDAQDKYTEDKENDATVVYLRDVLAGTNKKGLVTKAVGTVFIDKYVAKDATVVGAHQLAVDSTNPTEEYINYGCKQAETNIPAGASMKITLDGKYSNVQVGLKTSSEGAKYQINNGIAKSLNSSTDMYYKVTLNSDNTFTITNCSDVMIQITSIKAIK